MSAPNHAARRNRLIRQLRSEQIDCLLVSSQTNVRYLTGFTGDSTWLLVTPKECLLLSDTRFEVQLKNECPDLDAVIRTASQSMNVCVADIIRAGRFQRIGFEADHLTVSQHQALQQQLGDTPAVGKSGLVEELRMIKDRWEIDQIRNAVRAAERGFGVLRSLIRSELTERQLRYRLEEAMRDFGACGTAFEPIVGVGPTASMPHAHAGDRTVAEHPALLIDWGAQTFTGYRSDLTRVLVTSKPTRQVQQVYEVVLKAQQAAIAAVRPGMTGRMLDAVAREVIAEAGFGDYFGHSLGHGIGLDIHESPRVSPTSDQILRPGMVITVEPGIYLPGKFGVRIEDDVLITATGGEILTSVPKEFDQAVLEYLA
jgi:Xaa-Pro aminopeptidase